MNPFNRRHVIAQTSYETRLMIPLSQLQPGQQATITAHDGNGVQARRCLRWDWCAAKRSWQSVLRRWAIRVLFWSKATVWHCGAKRLN